MTLDFSRPGKPTDNPFIESFTTEFLWQEGHTAHATEQEAEEEARLILSIYSRFAADFAALSVVRGQKSDSERFAGAVRTYTIEAMMGDLKALQAGTSHFLGQNFARAFNIQFRNQENQHDYAWQTSWGLSTRMVGAIIMAHGDDQGLVLPPAVAPYQVVLIPVLRRGVDREPIMEACRRIMNELKEREIRATLDDRDDVSPGFKFNDWEMRGVPIRLELGPKDLELQKVVCARRDTGEKSSLDLNSAVSSVKDLLRTIQDNLLQRSQDFRKANTHEIESLDQLKTMFAEEGGKGFASCFRCGRSECDQEIKNLLGVTNRCFPFEDNERTGPCIVCGSSPSHRAILGRAY